MRRNAGYTRAQWRSINGFPVEFNLPPTQHKKEWEATRPDLRTQRDAEKDLLILLEEMFARHPVEFRR